MRKQDGFGSKSCFGKMFGKYQNLLKYMFSFLMKTFLKVAQKYAVPYFTLFCVFSWVKTKLSIKKWTVRIKSRKKESKVFAVFHRRSHLISSIIWNNDADIFIISPSFCLPVRGSGSAVASVWSSIVLGHPALWETDPPWAPSHLLSHRLDKTNFFLN